ncbi:MAG: type II toxin-antitoxin system prevent-host-death family antitoxin [Actinobacteria bacterium]|nr:type II toxin-antitoxin system prevent-host-death family antitoxin [Actinomycetota bacterium]
MNKSNKPNKPNKSNAEYNFKETGRVSVAEAKSNFSEYISRVAFANEKLIITKRGKPIAGLVSLEDIKKLKRESASGGLSQAIGKWENFDEIKSEIKKIYNKRSKEQGRNVSF